MNLDKNKQPNFSPEDVNKVLQAREAAALLQMLSRDGGISLSKAKTAMESGNYAQAMHALKPMLSSPESEKLLQELNRKLGRP